MKIAHHGHEAQSHGAAGRKERRTFISVIACGGKMLRRGLVRKVTRGDDMGHGGAVEPADTAALRQMHFKKCPVLACEATEGAERLDDACSPRPAAARASSQRDHGDGAGSQRFFAELTEARLHRLPCIEDFLRRYVLNEAGNGKTILRKTDASGAEIRLNALMLDGIETVFCEKRVECDAVAVCPVALWQKTIEEASRTVGGTGGSVAGLT